MYCICSRTHVEIKRKLGGVGSFFLPRGFYGTVFLKCAYHLCGISLSIFTKQKRENLSSLFPWNTSLTF